MDGGGELTKSEGSLVGGTQRASGKNRELGWDNTWSVISNDSTTLGRSIEES